MIWFEKRVLDYGKGMYESKKKKKIIWSFGRRKKNKDWFKFEFLLKVKEVYKLTLMKFMWLGIWKLEEEVRFSVSRDKVIYRYCNWWFRKIGFRFWILEIVFFLREIFLLGRCIVKKLYFEFYVFY